jgi:uncharacterized protein (TIGR02271 family)
MTNPQQVGNLVGSTAYDSNGDKIGKVGQAYLNDETGDAEWVTVHTGLFGTRESFAPLYGARGGDGEVRLAVTKQQVKEAPHVGTDGPLEGADVDALYQHYAGHTGRDDLAGGNAGTAAGGRTEDDSTIRTEGDDTTRAAGYETSGRTTDDAMTRSEERLRVGTESVPAARARLRKYVVTENVTRTIPVSHEEVRLEREPITDANRDAALDGPDIGEEEHAVTLNAERPVVEKETVPVERVRLATNTVTEQQEVSDQVRKEQIEDPDVDTAARRDQR